MINISSSVLSKIKNKAKESGRSNQLCMQLFCQEEFLRRLSKSEYTANFILKGGLFIYALTNFDSRVTTDVDFLMRHLPNTPEKIKEIIESIFEVDTGNDYIAFSIKKVCPISANKQYPGIHVDIIAKIENTKTPFGIDIGVGDIVVPKSQIRKMPTQVEGFTSPKIRTYSIESTIAEKLDAILSFMEFSGRMKDYYDIWYLANKFSFQGEELKKAIEKTLRNRNHHVTLQQFEEIILFSQNVMMKKRWDLFVKKINVRVDFEMVLMTINQFLYRPIQYALTEREFNYQWDLATGKWKKNKK